MLVSEEASFISASALFTTENNIKTAGRIYGQEYLKMRASLPEEIVSCVCEDIIVDVCFRSCLFNRIFLL